MTTAVLDHARADLLVEQRARLTTPGSEHVKVLADRGRRFRVCEGLGCL